MNIAKLNKTIKIEKNKPSMDIYGNHITVWSEVFQCKASISEREWSSEKSAAGMTVEHPRVQVTVRYSQETAVITSTEYRLIIDGDIYNIIAVDHMNYQKKSIKLICTKERG